MTRMQVFWRDLNDQLCCLFCWAKLNGLWQQEFGSRSLLRWQPSFFRKVFKNKNKNNNNGSRSKLRASTQETYFDIFESNKMGYTTTGYIPWDGCSPLEVDERGKLTMCFACFTGLSENMGPNAQALSQPWLPLACPKKKRQNFAIVKKPRQNP